MTYPDRKALLAPTGRCMRVGCGKECQEDHLLCEGCAVDHRRRNRMSMRRSRNWRRVQLRWEL
jgi:hypothetical protein